MTTEENTHKKSAGSHHAHHETHHHSNHEANHEANQEGSEEKNDSSKASAASAAKNGAHSTNEAEANQASASSAAEIAAANPTAELQAKVKEAEQKYIYLYAEFENFKKRSLKERQDIVKFGWENVASELLGVLDNLDRALQFAKPETDPNLMSGLKMVSQQFASTLEKQGVQAILTENQMFNPDLHEGVGQLPSEKPAGTIVQEVQKGYTLHGRLLRASRVLVSSGVAAN